MRMKIENYGIILAAGEVQDGWVPDGMDWEEVQSTSH